MPSPVTVLLLSPFLVPAMFWLWLVIWPAGVTNLCPDGCWCDHEENYVNCSSLNSIPIMFPTGVQGLMLEDSRITSLEKDAFDSRGLNDLLLLTINYCQVETIELGAFNGLAELIFLSLTGNEIREIIPRTFQNMRSLKYLYLWDNIIEHLEVDVFLGLDNLAYIELGANNLLNLHPDLFVGLSKLQGLYLSTNPDLQIPSDRHFINSHSLTQLDISGCNVRSVSVETFEGVTALELLDLGYNNLTSVELNILKLLPKLSELYIDNNPLQCDCQLQTVWRWCQDHNIETVHEAEVPECDTPSKVQGVWWGVLEVGQCLQGDMYYYEDYKKKQATFIFLIMTWTWASTNFSLIFQNKSK
jgi:Leucine-rich repeat (LRR) protein